MIDANDFTLLKLDAPRVKLVRASCLQPLAYTCQALMEVGQSIEDDRRALEAEGAVKIRKIEVDFEHFEVCGVFRLCT